MFISIKIIIYNLSDNNRDKVNENFKMTFVKDNFLEGVKNGDLHGLELKRIINEKVNKTIAEDLHSIVNYHEDELCDHLEERLRKEN